MPSLRMRLLPYVAAIVFVTCVYSLLAACSCSVFDWMVRNMALAGLAHPIHQVGACTVAYFALLYVCALAAVALTYGTALVIVVARWLVSRMPASRRKGNCRPKVA